MFRCDCYGLLHMQVTTLCKPVAFIGKSSSTFLLPYCCAMHSYEGVAKNWYGFVILVLLKVETEMNVLNCNTKWFINRHSWLQMILDMLWIFFFCSKWTKYTIISALPSLFISGSGASCTLTCVEFILKQFHQSESGLNLRVVIFIHPFRWGLLKSRA